MENVVDIGRKMGTIKVKNSDFLSPEELAYTPDDKVQGLRMVHTALFT